MMYYKLFHLGITLYHPVTSHNASRKIMEEPQVKSGLTWSHTAGPSQP